MFGLYVRVKVDSQKRHELLQLFDYISEKLEDGCLDCCVYKDIHCPDSLVLIEQWTDSDSLSLYMKSDKYRAVLGGIKTLGTLDQASTLDFGELSANDLCD